MRTLVHIRCSLVSYAYIAASLLDLPDEILEKCFCNLSFGNLTASLCISKRLSRIITGRPLYQTVVLPTPAAVVMFRRHLLYNSRYQQLVLDLALTFEDIEVEEYSLLGMLAPLLELLPHLQSLDMPLSLPGENWQIIVCDTLISSNRRLLHLRLGQSQVGSTVWKSSTIISLAELPSLKSLDLQCCDIFHTVPSRCFSQLQEVVLTCHSFYHGEFETLLQALPSSLASLALKECTGVPSNAMALIAKACPLVQILYIWYNELSDASSHVPPGYDWSTAMPSLRCLALSGGLASAFGLVRLRCPLRRVYLSNMQDLDASAAALLVSRWSPSPDGLHVSIQFSHRNKGYTVEELRVITVH